MNKTAGYQYKLWYEKYFVEDFYDNVSIETSVDVDVIVLSKSAYIVPYSDFLLKFDSDGSVKQAGFVLHIEKFGKLGFLKDFYIKTENFESENVNKTHANINIQVIF